MTARSFDCEKKSSRENSMMCSEKGMKLFGVRILSGLDEEVDVMRKSASSGNLDSMVPSEHTDPGYLSDGLVPSYGKGKRDRKRGLPWTKEEHRTFLEGLGKLGKGDWKGISRKFVITRTPTQVASHAQKYFIRQTASNKKRRSSLFDMAINDAVSKMDGESALSLRRNNGNPERSNLSPPDENMVMEVPSIEACSVAPNYKSSDYMSGRAAETLIKYETLQSNMSLPSAPAPESPDLPYITLKPNHRSVCMHNFFQRASDTRPQLCHPSNTAAELELKGNRDLELSIAPPLQLSSSKFPAGMSTLHGAIRVIC